MLTRRKNKTMTDCYGPSMKQQNNLPCPKRALDDLSIKERLRLLNLNVLFASKNNLFTTLSKPIDSTMVGAWSRQCEIQQEIVYAV
jgi:hypothetical protein